ncbi:MAG TPA: MmgE/PrpD family protein, partial [Pirellulales bacterium]
MSNEFVTLSRDTNQARGLGQYAIDFLGGRFAGPDEGVLRMVERFHLDSMACGVSALAGGANAPTVLRREALEYECRPRDLGASRNATEGVPYVREANGCRERTQCRSDGVPCFGSRVPVKPEKAVVANCSAVREWDANGTNFGFNPARGHTKGEFGHNDYYPVAVAAAQLAGFDGRQTLLAMILLDEIRGRLAEVFALKNYKIDHVLYGAIASAAVFAAALRATAEQIESAIGLVVAHYVPFRAIRAGHQLSDSKGASAAISSEAAVLSAERAMRGFVGPGDIFRNPEAVFCLFEKPAHKDESPFDLVLGASGSDFAVMG